MDSKGLNSGAGGDNHGRNIPITHEKVKTATVVTESKVTNTSGKYKVRRYNNLPYHRRADGTLVSVDVYRPIPIIDSADASATAEIFPTVVYLHGGGWALGGKNTHNTADACTQLCLQGNVVVATDYALTTLSNSTATTIFLWWTCIMAFIATFVKHLRDFSIVFLVWLVLSSVLVAVLLSRSRRRYRHPDHVLECSAAVRWSRDNAAFFQGSPVQLHLMGHSAGGHLAALIATNALYLQSVGMSPRDLRSCTCISGVYNNMGLLDTVIQRGLLHEVFGGEALVQNDAFPIHHAQPQHCPPFLLLNAGYDLTLKRHTREFYSVLQNHHIYVETHTYETTNHVSIILDWDTKNARVLFDILAFMQRCS